MMMMIAECAFIDQPKRYRQFSDMYYVCVCFLVWSRGKHINCTPITAPFSISTAIERKTNHLYIGHEWRWWAGGELNTDPVPPTHTHQIYIRPFVVRTKRHVHYQSVGQDSI